jgi:hypothetical protein
MAAPESECHGKTSDPGVGTFVVRGGLDDRQSQDCSTNLAFPLHHSIVFENYIAEYADVTTSVQTDNVLSCKETRLTSWDIGMIRVQPMKITKFFRKRVPGTRNVQPPRQLVPLDPRAARSCPTVGLTQSQSVTITSEGVAGPLPDLELSVRVVP